MKSKLLICLTLVATSYSSETVTEGLLASQADLALGHRFFETAIFMNQMQLSSYLFEINREIVESHIDTYAFIKELGTDTAYELVDMIEVAPGDAERECLRSILLRGRLQTAFYGHGLANCVRSTYNLLKSWNEYLNGLHATAQLTGNQVQNTGVNVLSQTQIFDGHENFPATINRAYRELLKHYLSYRDRFDGFVDVISSDVLNTIRDLVSCDAELGERFQREVESDMARARGCVGDLPGTDASIPT